MQHLVADRAQLSALERLLRCRQAAYYQLASPGGAELSLAECSDLFFANGCALHDVQNALKWCLEPHLKGDMLSDMHIILESLRSNAHKLLEGLPKHLIATSEERDAEQIAGLDARQQFWSLLGVEASMLERVANIDPWFEDGSLLVNPLDTGDSDDLEELSAVVMYLMRWRCFTESRFLSMAEAATGFLGSMCCGLTRLAKEVSGHLFRGGDSSGVAEGQPRYSEVLCSPGCGRLHSFRAASLNHG